MAAPKKDPVRVPASQELIDIARRMNEAKLNISRWSEIVDACKEEIRDLMHYHSGDGAIVAVTASGLKVTEISETIRMLLDEDALKRDYPDLDLAKYKTRPSIATMIKTHAV